MLKNLLIACCVVACLCEFAAAQGSLKKKLNAARRSGELVKEAGDDSDDKRNDVEGTIWEFKVIDRQEKDGAKKTKMTGNFRIKQSAVFSVGEVSRAKKLGGRKSKDGGAGIKGQLKNRLSDRLKKTGEDEIAEERIGDLSKSKPRQMVIRFDEDNNHPLSGRVELKPDTKHRAGVWSGKYVEYLKGNKKKSWRMELRKVED